MMFGNSQKIKVEMLRDGLPIKSKKYKIEKGKIIIRKEKLPYEIGYEVNYDRNCLIPYMEGMIFKKLAYKVILIENADKCIPMKRDLKINEIPLFDRKTEEEFLTAKVIKNAGLSFLNIKLPTAFWIISIASLILTIFSILLSSGKIKIG